MERFGFTKPPRWAEITSVLNHSYATNIAMSLSSCIAAPHLHPWFEYVRHRDNVIFWPLTILRPVMRLADTSCYSPKSFPLRAAGSILDLITRTSIGVEHRFHTRIPHTTMLTVKDHPPSALSVLFKDTPPSNMSVPSLPSYFLLLFRIAAMNLICKVGISFLTKPVRIRDDL
ncbi:hypothetical protein CPB85DRAFT_1561300 [Mucidula mucida]|nr:hypothetical protein CPB85DRAFT_1561300 [Mucidula mucida]